MIKLNNTKKYGLSPFINSHNQQTHLKRAHFINRENSWVHRVFS